MDSSLKLAELYTQQGLFNDARAQYLQIAEDFMKNGDLDQAVRLFQKVLEMDPENVPMRVKLAEVYLRLGKKKQAWEIFSAAAESLRSRGSLAAAEDILKRMQTLDPGSSYVLLLRGRSALESDDPKSAIGYLEKTGDLDSHPEGLRDLLKAYLQVGDAAKAGPVAEKLLAVHNDPEGLFLLAEGCTRLGQYRQALDIYTRHADRLLTTDSAKLLGSLHSMITHVRDDADALDSLLLLLNKAGESTHVNEVTELLAHASVQDGNLARARDLYQMLATTEPQNLLHLQNYQQVVSRMEDASPTTGITAEEGALLVEELEAIAPVIDQSYPDDIAIAVRSAVTDADLFLSYNLPDKAVVPLLGALPQAPRDTRLNQRLAALHTRFHRFTEAAVCCRTLESVYHDAGCPDEAVRYGELAARYEQNMAAAPSPAAARPATASPAAAPPAPWPMAATVAPGHEIAAAHPEFTVHEMAVHPPTDAHELHPGLASDFSSDLASEWENSLSVDAPADEAVELTAVEGDTSASSEIAETAEEVRFYLDHFMTDQARAAIQKLESLTSDPQILDPLRAALASNGQPLAEPEPEITEINADEPADFEIAMEAQHESVAAEDLVAGHAPVTYTHDATPDETHAEIHRDAPAELQPDAEPVCFEPAHAEPVHAEAVHAEAGELTALVADLEASLGDSFPQAPPLAVEPPAVDSPATHLPLAQPLPVWPVAPAPQPAPMAQASTVPVEVETPAAAAIAASSAPSAGGSATAAAPALEVPATIAATTVAATTVPTTTAPTMSYSPTPERPLAAEAQTSAAGSIDLSEMFGELKQELEEEIVAGDDDPETHYSLGVAFREMGLLDEAIAELQKVCTAIDRGGAFSQRVQTYTWLAQCFLDKGVPQAAIRWYEKALHIPGLDAEARLAINYELGSACESAQDKPAALRHFTDVYGTNIDYRDVAERIHALRSQSPS